MITRFRLEATGDDIESVREELNALTVDVLNRLKKAYNNNVLRGAYECTEERIGKTESLYKPYHGRVVMVFRKDA